MSLDTVGGRVFVKGLRSDHPGVVTQGREAVVAPYVTAVSPRLLWHANTGGWNLLGIEYVEGRHADYRPGSTDLPAVLEVLDRLARIECPDLPELKRPVQRWNAYIDGPAELDMLSGDTLLHTDLNPLNILIDPAGRAHLVDWAWPTRGAAFIDPCVFAFRFVAAGHTPAAAERWAARASAWTDACPTAIDTFARANARLWAHIAHEDPQPWKQHMADAARVWSESRVAAR